MKKDNTSKDIFLASFRLHSADIDEDTKSRLSKLISHRQKTISIALVVIPVFWFANIYFRSKGIDLRFIIPAVLFLALYARYHDLYKQGLEIIKNLEKKANKSSEPT